MRKLLSSGAAACRHGSGARYLAPPAAGLSAGGAARHSSCHEARGADPPRQRSRAEEPSSHVTPAATSPSMVLPTSSQTDQPARPERSGSRAEPIFTAPAVHERREPRQVEPRSRRPSGPDSGGHRGDQRAPAASGAPERREADEDADGQRQRHRATAIVEPDEHRQPLPPLLRRAHPPRRFMAADARGRPPRGPRRSPAHRRPGATPAPPRGAWRSFSRIAERPSVAAMKKIRKHALRLRVSPTASKR